MSYLLWQHGGATRTGSARLVFRAAEVPLLADAQALRDAMARLHDDAAQQLARATDEARAVAHAEGLEQGRRAAADELTGTIASLARDAAHERERLRHDIGALALQVVRRLIGQLPEDERLLALADAAAREVLPEAPVALVVHPEVCDAVRERMARLAAAGGLRCEVRGDAACSRGACRLETAFGSLDASLDAQLARIEAAWADASAYPDER